MIDLEEQAFALWAFGDSWDDFLSNPKRKAIHLLKTWNRLHSDLLILYTDGNISDDMKEMKRIWKELHGQKKTSESDFINNNEEQDETASFCYQADCMGNDENSNLSKKPGGQDRQENAPSHEADGNSRKRHKKRQVEESSKSASKSRKEERETR